MEVNPKLADSGWFVVHAGQRHAGSPSAVTLVDRIKKALGIAEWSDLLVEGDEPYFGF